MCIICTKEYTNDITELNCNYCTKVTTIPLLKNLTKLECSNCENLTSLALHPPDGDELRSRPEGSSIPQLENLTRLNVSFCTNLTSILYLQI